MEPALEQEYLEYVTARLEPLRRTAYLLCGDRHRADDLVQETITKLYVRWRRVRTTGNVNAYVGRILYRTYLDDRRRGWWARVHLSASPPDHPAAPGGDLEDRMMLDAALARVPDRQRAVLILRFVCDLPVDEVAQILNCAAGTVKSQTAHGLAAMRRRLGAPTIAALKEKT
ncbi:MAG TPA: SigE family RNA polymerase sigma factor [Micromonosporaceae bacterium]|jgi:RNA polymerase sigma-70 factor (sigma-E family)|nr:SigE family RNA polymerase sigma factor [Micromonosporaceae bacterium]